MKSRRHFPPLQSFSGAWSLVAICLITNAVADWADPAAQPAGIAPDGVTPVAVAAKPSGGGEQRSHGTTVWNWRRTQQGWEAVGWTAPTHIARPLPVHPVLLALFQLLLSVLALMAFNVELTVAGDSASRPTSPILTDAEPR